MDDVYCFGGNPLSSVLRVHRAVLVPSPVAMRSRTSTVGTLPARSTSDSMLRLNPPASTLVQVANREREGDQAQITGETLRDRWI